MIYKLLLVALYFAVALVVFRLQSVLRHGFALCTNGSSDVQHVLPCTLAWLCCRIAQRFSASRQCQTREDSTVSEGGLHSNVDASVDGQKSRFLTAASGVDSSSCLDALHFNSIEHFSEHVEDTKACVWVVLVVQQRSRTRNMAVNGRRNATQWQRLCSRLSRAGVRLGSYDCRQDPTLCQRTGTRDTSLLLTMPKGARPKGKVATFLFQGFDLHDNETVAKAEHWIVSTLDAKVRVVHVNGTLEDAVERIGAQPTPGRQQPLGPSATLAYSTNHNSTPLLLAVLSVKFTGRVDFLHLTNASNTVTEVERVSNEKGGMSPHFWLMPKHTSKTNTPFNSSKHFGYHHLDIFLRTLHPETNDIFLAVIFLLNLACLLDLFTRDGGPLKRFVYSVWVTSCANTVLIFTWLPLLKLFFLPQMLPVMRTLLTVVQCIMISEFVSAIRDDLVEVFGHLALFLAGFLIYSACIGYIKYKAFCSRSGNMTSWSAIIAHDIHDIKQIIAPLFYRTSQPEFDASTMEEGLEYLIRYLAVPNLWLCSMDPLDNLTFTKTFTHCCSPTETGHVCSGNRPCEIPKEHTTKQKECAICMEEYACGDTLSKLNCGHCFHKNCISGWICSSTKYRCRTCPTCRHPINQCKPQQQKQQHHSQNSVPQIENMPTEVT